MEIARDKAMQNLRQGMEGNLQIIDSHMEVLSSPSDSIIRIKVFAESIEDIGVEQPIDAGNNSS